MAKIDTQTVMNFLINKWGTRRPCPMCGASAWAIQDKTFLMLEFNENGLILGGPVIVVIPVICSNCGNTVLINPKLAGISGITDINEVPNITPNSQTGSNSSTAPGTPNTGEAG